MTGVDDSSVTRHVESGVFAIAATLHLVSKPNSVNLQSLKETFLAVATMTSTLLLVRSDEIVKSLHTTVLMPLLNVRLKPVEPDLEGSAAVAVNVMTQVVVASPLLHVKLAIADGALAATARSTTSRIRERVAGLMDSSIPRRDAAFARRGILVGKACQRPLRTRDDSQYY